jgi:hypothetical protein
MFRMTYLPSVFDTMDRIFDDAFGRVYTKSYSTDYRVIKYDDRTIHYHNGIVHREDGPAIEYVDKKKEPEYYLDGVRIDKKSFEDKLEEKARSKKYTIYVDDQPIEVDYDTYKKLKNK